MLRSSFIRTTTAKPAEHFVWPLSLNGRVTHTICVPGIRAMLEATFKETDGLLVAYTAERLYVAQRSLQASQRALEAGSDHPTSYGLYRPSDLPSVRAALAIINPIVAALSGVEEKREAA